MCITKQENMKAIISKSLEERAITLIIEKGLNPIEAVKQAILDENKLIEEIISQKTDRAKKALKIMQQNTYSLIHLTK